MRRRRQAPRWLGWVLVAAFALVYCALYAWSLGLWWME